jgi:predicted enzyme related to lactoylglutathione lyase
MPLQETPNGLRFAYLADPDGSTFGVWTPPAN